MVRVWTKRGVGHGLGHGVGHGLLNGLPYGPPYGLPVVIFFKTRLSIAVNLCKQRAPTTRKHVKPYSMKIIMFVIVKAMGRCITSLVVSTYFTYLTSDNSSVNASKQGFRQGEAWR